jgi:hypothetical protein
VIEAVEAPSLEHGAVTQSQLAEAGPLPVLHTAFVYALVSEVDHSGSFEHTIILVDAFK